MRYLLIVFLFSFSMQSEAFTKSCRSQSIKKEFDYKQGYPKGRKGYIVDHICPLSCGGLDILENLQYQTIAEAKAKDKWETKPAGCSILCNSTNSLPTRTVFNCK